MKILLSLLFLISITFSNLSVANDNCNYSSDKYVYQDEISQECQQQLKENSLLYASADGNKNSLKLITDTNYFKIAFDIVFEDKLPEYDKYKSFYFFVISIAMFLIATMFVASVFIFIAVIVGIFNAAQGEGSVGKNIGSVLLKLPFIIISKQLYFWCAGLGITLLLAFSYNVINVKKSLETSTASVEQITTVSAEKDAKEKVSEIIKYHTCSIINDKRLMFDAHLTDNYRFNDSSKYSKCMVDSPSSQVAGINDTSYNSLYFRQTLNCGTEYFGVENMSCASSDFKRDNLIIKKAIEDNETLAIKVANDFIKYACANNTGYSSNETHQFYQYCFDLNPLTREITYKENGQVNLIKNAPSVDDLNKGVADLTKILVDANKASALKNIQENFMAKNIKINELNAFMVFVMEDQDLNLLKMLSNQAHDYFFNFDPDLSFNKKETFFQRFVNLFTEDEYIYPEIHDRIINEIEFASINKNNLVQDLIFPAIDFLGSDITQRLGISSAGNQTLRYNVIGSIMTAGLNSSNNLLIAASTASIINKTSILITTARVDTKPSFLAKKIEQFSGIFAFLLWKAYLLAIGLFIFGLASVVKVIASAYFDWFANTIKLLNTKDAVLAFNMNGKTGLGFSEFGEKLVGYCYVVLMPSVILLAFLMSLVISYFNVYILNNTFFYIIETIGLFDKSDLGAAANFLTALFIYYFVILYIQYIVFYKTINAISNSFIIHISGSQERTVQSLVGVQGDERSMSTMLRPKGRV